MRGSSILKKKHVLIAFRSLPNILSYFGELNKLTNNSFWPISGLKAIIGISFFSKPVDLPEHWEIVLCLLEFLDSHFDSTSSSVLDY